MCVTTTGLDAGCCLRGTSWSCHDAVWKHGTSTSDHSTRGRMAPLHPPPQYTHPENSFNISAKLPRPYPFMHFHSGLPTMHDPRQYKARLLATTKSPTTSFPFFCLVKEVPLIPVSPRSRHPSSSLLFFFCHLHETESMKKNIPFVEDLATPI